MSIPSAVAGQNSHSYSMSLKIISSVLPCILQALNADDIGILGVHYLILLRLPCFELTYANADQYLGQLFYTLPFHSPSALLSAPSPSRLSCWKPIRACLDQLFDQCIDGGCSYLSESGISTYDAADVLWEI